MKNFYKYKNSFVESCHVRYYKGGIVNILFNVKNRWLPYGRYNDFTFWFENKDGKETIVELTEKQIKLEELPKGEFYLRYHNQEKDQIEFIYIPSNLMK